MNTALLVLHLTFTTNGVAQVRFVTPGPGSYSVQASNDLHCWRVLQSGWNAGPVHVGVTDRNGQPCAFYRVEWRGR